MWQEIIVYVILGVVVFYTIFRWISKRRKIKNAKNGCDDCPLKNKCDH
jgi:hypothetical protein